MGKFRLLLLLLVAVGRQVAADFIVAPGGSPSGDGSYENPWDLNTVLAHPPVIQPGDHIWLRGGVYRGSFVSKLAGTAERPIVLRNYGSERVILEYPDEPKELQVLRIDGAWTWYWGLEVVSSWERRIDPPKNRPTGVNVYGPNVKLINMVIHDTFGVGFWSGSDDSEMYGNIVFNNGNDLADRGHGHGIYAQNRTGSKRIADNIVFQSFSHGLHIFGSDEAYLNNFHLEGNVSFNNGVLSAFGEERNILIGGGVVANNPVLISNYTYWSRADALGQNNIGYLAGCNKVVAKNNYFARGIAFILINCPAESITGNTFIGSVSGFDRVAFPDNTYVPYGTRPTSGVHVFVRPNRYEPGRGHVIVYNWDDADEVEVSLQDVVPPGRRFELRDVQNLFGPPVATGTFDGTSVRLPMHLKEVTPTVGEVPRPPVHTSREFGVFLVNTLPEEAPQEPAEQEAVPDSGNKGKADRPVMARTQDIR